jgi:arylsulfatase I/J
MWSNTLMVYTSDNGGPAGKASSGHSGNNWPLRGGKTNVFEGGIRVTAFVTGGFLPQNLQGTKREGYIHGADWYATLCHLAGADPTDTPAPNPAGIPPIDSMNMWPYLTGDATASPRTQMLISTGSPNVAGGAVIDGEYKLVLDVQTYGFWQGPIYPNATTNHNSETPFQCGSGCLFNIQTDPSEYIDLAKSMPDKLAEMQALFKKLAATAYQAPKWPTDAAKCKAYVTANGGSVGPYEGPCSNT